MYFEHEQVKLYDGSKQILQVQGMTTFCLGLRSFLQEYKNIVEKKKQIVCEIVIIL